MEKTQMILSLLEKKYNTTIVKKELAEILSCSISYIDKCLMSGKNIPDYKRLGTSKIVFNLVDVAVYLADTTIVCQY